MDDFLDDQEYENLSLELHNLIEKFYKEKRLHRSELVDMVRDYLSETGWEER